MRALDLALLPNSDLVPEDLRPKYRRFLLANFQARARQLGWTPRPGESDDVRLLRPRLLRVVSTVGGDEELGKQATELADRWLKEHSAISPDVRDAVLRTAAYYGDRPLFDRFFAAYLKAEDPQEKQALLIALIGFRDKQIVQDELGFVESGKVPLPDGIIFLFSPGSASPNLRKLPFEAITANYDQLLKSHPNVFGFSLGTILPQVGEGLCDAQDRSEYASFFGPRVSSVEGAARPYAQTLEKSICASLSRKRKRQVWLRFCRATNHVPPGLKCDSDFRMDGDQPLLQAQTGRIYTSDDYSRAANLLNAGTFSLVDHAVRHATFISNDRFWYLDSENGLPTLMVADARGEPGPPHTTRSAWPRHCMRPGWKRRMRSGSGPKSLIYSTMTGA